MKPVIADKKSPEDKRDYVLEIKYPVVAVSVLPKKIDYRNCYDYVADQGELGTCSAQAAAAIKECQEYNEDKLAEHMSPAFVYNNRENQDSGGMYPRDTMKILQKMGIVPERIYPYKNVDNKIPIPLSVYDKASNFKIKEYNQISTIDGLKHALCANGPCYIAFPVYSYSDPIWKGSTLMGFHACTVVGYDDDKQHFIIRNSWGPTWGEKGYCYFPYSDWGMHSEVWTLIDDESMKVKDFLYKGNWFEKMIYFFKHTVKEFVVKNFVAVITVSVFTAFLIIGIVKKLTEK